MDLKAGMERCLSQRQLLHCTQELIINALLSQKCGVYASFQVTQLHHMYDRYLWDPYAVYTYFRYGCEGIPVVIWFSGFRSASEKGIFRHRAISSIKYRFGVRPVRSLSFFGVLSWDGERRVIDAVPLIITNIQP